MGLLEAVRDTLGWGAERAATRDGDPDALFALSTGHVTMAAELDHTPVGEAGLCLGAVDSTDFEAAMRDVRDVLAVGEAETGTTARTREDAHGYVWVVLADDDIEDLLTAVHFAADTLADRGYGNRLLAAVFGFERADRRAYWVYSFRRGTWYPFAPRGDHGRDERLEFALEAVLDGELPVEPARGHRFPLWPDTPGGHPWE